MLEIFFLQSSEPSQRFVFHRRYRRLVTIASASSGRAVARIKVITEAMSLVKFASQVF